MPQISRLASGSGRYDVVALTSAADLLDVADAWNAVASSTPSPFLTAGWLAAWEEVYGAGSSGVLLRDGDGRVAAGGWLPRPRAELRDEALGELHDWDVVAVDDDARAAAWHALLEHAPRRMRYPGLVADTPATAVARRALEATRHRVLDRPGYASPRLELPESADALMASVSRNLRSQVGRRRRALEREGALELRTVRDGPADGPALDAFLAVEASGWKRKSGTAILANPRTERLFRAFAECASRAGVLRLYLLELDGRTVAADFGAAVGGTGFLMKTGYDEELGRLSPGLVLRAEVLRASIEEGLRAYDFLGGTETYKLQWGAVPRPRVELVAFRGPLEALRWAWLARLRPAAVPLARRVLRRPAPTAPPALAPPA
jgi:CelD/BcsL family acetyltransferase involved in cellulose biosynthesis